MPCTGHLLTGEELEVRLGSRIARVPGRMRRQRPTPDHTGTHEHYKNMDMFWVNLVDVCKSYNRSLSKVNNFYSSDILGSLKLVF